MSVQHDRCDRSGRRFEPPEGAVLILPRELKLPRSANEASVPFRSDLGRFRLRLADHLADHAFDVLWCHRPMFAPVGPVPQPVAAGGSSTAHSRDGLDRLRPPLRTTLLERPQGGARTPEPPPSRSSHI